MIFKCVFTLNYSKVTVKALKLTVKLEMEKRFTSLASPTVLYEFNVMKQFYRW